MNILIEKNKTCKDHLNDYDSESIVIENLLSEFNQDNDLAENFELETNYDTGVSESQNSPPIYPFQNQDINAIRKQNKHFQDQYFTPSLAVLSRSPKSNLINDMLKSMGFSSYQQLERTIGFVKCSVIFQRYQRNIEFVLDHHGQPLGNCSDVAGYSSLFTTYDIYQGCLGDCFLLSAILGLVRNKELLAFIMPVDNSYKNNIKIGAYHFRLWNLGNWYDVVVDDYLLCDSQYNLKFTKNEVYLNEIWICLFEKAVAKFVGDFEAIHGNYLISATIMLSGGMYDYYSFEAVKFVTNKTKINSIFGKYILESFGKDYKKCIPTVDEFFQIIKFAIKQNCIVGVNASDLGASSCSYYGVIFGHEYAVTDAVEINNLKIVKVHNPHNVADNIKKTQQYLMFEQNLCYNYGLPKTYLGEFYMQFADFISCFEFLSIVNVFPNHSLPSISNKLAKLYTKTVNFISYNDSIKCINKNYKTPKDYSYTLGKLFI